MSLNEFSKDDVFVFSFKDNLTLQNQNYSHEIIPSTANYCGYTVRKRSFVRENCLIIILPKIVLFLFRFLLPVIQHILGLHFNAGPVADF